MSQRNTVQKPNSPGFFRNQVNSVNTLEAFRVNQAALLTALKSASSLSEADVAIQMAFERTAATLAQSEADETTRQRVQAVLAVAKQSGIFLKSVRAEGRLTAASQAETADPAKKDPKQYGLYAGLILLAFLAVYEIINGKWMFALLAVIAVLLMKIGQDALQPRDSMPKWRAEGQAKIDPEAAVHAVEEMCRSIDIAVTDLSLIDREYSVRAAGSQEDAMLDFMSALLEARESGREDLVMESAGEAETALRRLGIDAVSYTPEHADLFDLLPTIGEARTVRPALISGEHVLRRGVAAVRMQEVGR